MTNVTTGVPNSAYLEPVCCLLEVLLGMEVNRPIIGGQGKPTSGRAIEDWVLVAYPCARRNEPGSGPVSRPDASADNAVWATVIHRGDGGVW